MQNGDLSNEINPRVYVVFEGTLAQPVPGAAHGLLAKLRRPKVSDYQIDLEVAMHIWDRWQRLGVRFDALTYSLDAARVQEALNDSDVPISNTYRFESVEHFVSGLPFMPWVYAVVDHTRPLAYGSKATTLAGLSR